MTAKTSTDRLDRLERTVYSLNGEPGLVEQVRDIAKIVDSHTRLLKLAIFLSAATFLDTLVPFKEILSYVLRTVG